MKRKTALLLDDDLVAEAREILGTTTTTETLNAALCEITNRAKRQRLIDRLATLDPEDRAAILTAWDKPRHGNPPG
jgi:Arc/MetJ family transcription regulator